MANSGLRKKLFNAVLQDSWPRKIFRRKNGPLSFLGCRLSDDVAPLHSILVPESSMSQPAVSDLLTQTGRGPKEFLLKRFFDGQNTPLRPSECFAMIVASYPHHSGLR